MGRVPSSRLDPRYTDGGQKGQPLNLQPARQPGQGTCVDKAVLLHEVFHAVGIMHEHQRSDREQYVRIDKNNVKREQWHNFNRYDETIINHWGLPYELKSFMHYPQFCHGMDIDSSKPVLTRVVSTGTVHYKGMA